MSIRKLPDVKAPDVSGLCGLAGSLRRVVCNIASPPRPRADSFPSPYLQCTAVDTRLALTVHKTSRWQQIQLEALINADPTEYTSVPCRCSQCPPPPPPLPPPSTPLLTLKGVAPARCTERVRHLGPYVVLFFCAKEFAGSRADSGFSRFTSRSAANSVSMETVREGGGSKRRQEGGGGGGGGGGRWGGMMLTS